VTGQEGRGSWWGKCAYQRCECSTLSCPPTPTMQVQPVLVGYTVTVTLIGRESAGSAEQWWRRGVRSLRWALGGAATPRYTVTDRERRWGGVAENGARGPSPDAAACMQCHACMHAPVVAQLSPWRWGRRNWNREWGPIGGPSPKEAACLWRGTDCGGGEAALGQGVVGVTDI
jgi:hypothetical protein